MTSSVVGRFDSERLAAASAANHLYPLRAAELRSRILQLGGETPILLGAVWFFVSLIFWELAAGLQCSQREKKAEPRLPDEPSGLGRSQYATARWCRPSGCFWCPG